MEAKKILQKAAQEGAKLAGKTFIKGAFDIKTWVLIYMAVVGTRAYNKLGVDLAREAEINSEAAKKTELQISTPKGLEATCQKYDLTPEQVKEVINMQREISNTQKTVMRTAQDSKSSWRRWLPFSEKLTNTGAKDGLGLKSDGQLDLALDAYKEAESNLRQKEQAKTNSVMSVRQ